MGGVYGMSLRPLLVDEGRATGLTAEQQAANSAVVEQLLRSYASCMDEDTAASKAEAAGYTYRGVQN